MMSVRSSKQFALSKGQNKTPNEYHSGSDSPSHTAVVSCAYVITISLETAVFFSHPDFTVGFGILVYESPNQPFASALSFQQTLMGRGLYRRLGIHTYRTVLSDKVTLPRRTFLYLILYHHNVLLFICQQ